jgi:hypothetical protein
MAQAVAYNGSGFLCFQVLLAVRLGLEDIKDFSPIRIICSQIQLRGRPPGDFRERESTLSLGVTRLYGHCCMNLGIAA